MNKLKDSVSALKNGYLANKLQIKLKNTRTNRSFLNLLVSEGFLLGHEQTASYLTVFLKYVDGMPSIREIRVFDRARQMPTTYIGLRRANRSRETIITTTATHGIQKLRRPSYRNNGGTIIGRVR